MEKKRKKKLISKNKIYIYSQKQKYLQKKKNVYRLNSHKRAFIA